MTPHLHDEGCKHGEDDSGVEVGDVEGGAQAAHEGVGAEQRRHDDNAELSRGILDEGLQQRRGGGDQTHDDDQVQQQREAAEDHVGARPKACVDHLKQQAQSRMESEVGVGGTTSCLSETPKVSVRKRGGGHLCAEMHLKVLGRRR